MSTGAEEVQGACCGLPLAVPLGIRSTSPVCINYRAKTTNANKHGKLPGKLYTVKKLIIVLTNLLPIKYPN